MGLVNVSWCETMIKWLIDALIESVIFSSAIGFAVFLVSGLLSWNWKVSLYLGAGIWLAFWMVMFCGELLNGKPIISEKE